PPRRSPARPASSSTPTPAPSPPGPSWTRRSGSTCASVLPDPAPELRHHSGSDGRVSQPGTGVRGRVHLVRVPLRAPAGARLPGGGHRDRLCGRGPPPGERTGAAAEPAVRGHVLGAL